METLDLNFIKARRLQLDISLKKMAEHLRMSNAANYWKYENGSYSLDAKHLPKLAEILDCNISDFFSQKVAVLEMQEVSK